MTEKIERKLRGKLKGELIDKKSDAQYVTGVDSLDRELATFCSERFAATCLRKLRGKLKGELIDKKRTKTSKNVVREIGFE